MYDWPEVQPRTDAFWARVAEALRARGIDAPEALSRPEDISAPWTDPDLLIGQTCGLPYVSGRCGKAVLVSRPCYGLEHANGGTYQSAIICHAEAQGDLAAFRGKRVAINEYGSQSGCNALAGHLTRQKLDREGPFFGQALLSGSHRASAQMVAERKADVAAIDAVAWALLEEIEPVRHARLRVLAWTRAMPSLPFITGPENRYRTGDLYAALLDAAFDCSEQRAAGTPTDFMPAPEDCHYDPIRKMAAGVKGLRLAPNAPPLGS